MPFDSKKYHREYRDKNRERIRQRQREWYEQHRDLTKARTRAWKEQNPERVRELGRADYHRHKARRVGARKAYEQTEAHKVSHAAKQRRRREQLAAVGPGDHRSVEYAAILLQDPCGYCGSREDVTIDHIVPVAQGGGGEWENLSAACRSCNSSKSDKSLLGWMVGRC